MNPCGSRKAFKDNKSNAFLLKLLKTDPAIFEKHKTNLVWPKYYLNEHYQYSFVGSKYRPFKRSGCIAPLLKRAPPPPLNILDPPLNLTYRRVMKNS